MRSDLFSYKMSVGWGGGRSEPRERKPCSQRDDNDSELQHLASAPNRGPNPAEMPTTVKQAFARKLG